MANRENWYAHVPQDIFAHSKDMTPEGFVIYTTLKLFQNKNTGLCCPSIRTICEASGISKPTVLNRINLLKTLGILEIKDYHHRKVNHYLFKIELVKQVDQVVNTVDQIPKLVNLDRQTGQSWEQSGQSQEFDPALSGQRALPQQEHSLNTEEQKDVLPSVSSNEQTMTIAQIMAINTQGKFTPKSSVAI